MFVEFFFLLKKAGLPVSITEFLALLGALKKNVAGADVETIDATLDPAPGAITGQVTAFGTTALPGVDVCAVAPQAAGAPSGEVTSVSGIPQPHFRGGAGRTGEPHSTREAAIS